jgi:hypothetical protein
MKEFFENPALLFGVPLLALGLVGIAVALAAMASYWAKPS